MGARTLEVSLRNRLFLAVGPMLVLVSVGYYAAVARALDRGNRDAAARRATAALRGYATERAEGDAPALAASQVVAAADAEGLYIVVRAAGLAAPMLGKLGALPGVSAELAPQTCAETLDASGHTWFACAEHDASTTTVVALPIDGTLATLRTLLFTMSGIVALGLLFTALAVRVATKKPLQGLTDLVKWTERVLAEERERAAPATTTEELTRLAAAFDALLHRLFASLERAQASSAHIAHELRTPLTAMRAELEAMPLSPDGAVERARADLKRLSHVIDSILVLSGPPERRPARTVVNVADIVRALCTHDTRVEAPDEALVRGDEHLIQLAIVNLLENAARYSDHPARAVRVARTEMHINVSVIDDGPGVAPDVLSRMFDRYWRADSSGIGTGLGLALVKAVAERHGGFAKAAPREGGGLEVTIALGGVAGWHQDR